MIAPSPTAALERHTTAVREVLVKVVRNRHERAVETHQSSESRYAMGFGTQWQDLLDDINDALTSHGFQSHKLVPAGYTLPVVNDCLVYVWRVPNTASAVSSFASSPTRKNGFTAAPPEPTLFESDFTDAQEADDVCRAESELEHMVRSVGGAMPLVLVMVGSSPRQLQSIEWAIAALNDALHGQESIWEPELTVDAAASNAESFDSGTPDGPTIEPREQDGPQRGA